MLRCNFICNTDGLRNGFCYDNFSVLINGFSCNFFARKDCQLPLKFI